MELRKADLGLIVSCRLNVFPRGQGFLHWHEAYEICQVVDGSCEVVIDGRRRTGYKGDLFFVNSRLPHYYHTGTCEGTVRFFLFHPKVILQTSKDCGLLKEYIPCHEIRSVEGLEKKLDSMFQMLDEEGMVSREDSFVKSLAATVYFLLLRHFGAEKCENGHLENERNEFYRAVEYINAHMTEHITTISLAEMLYVYRGRLAEIFVKYSGMTISEYLSTLRIQRANELMSAGKSVTEAALESGFSNIRTFNNVYKRQTGITPSEFRNRLK